MNADYHNRIAEMAGPMQRMANSKSADALLIYSLEQVLRSAGERQAQVLLRCALVRWFDADVLGVLRESDVGNERVLALLASYSFVRDLGDGRFTYHDEVRRTLLERWNQERPAERRTWHMRLYRYFNERRTPPEVYGPRPVSATVHGVPLSPQRELWRREALYHLLHADAAEGMRQLRASFEELETVHRLADAELLLQVTSDMRLDPKEQHWLTYLQARGQQSALQLEAAAARFEGLLHQLDAASEAELLAEVQRSLGMVLAETGRWAQATSYYQQSLAYFQRQNNQRAVAATLLLLGESYQGMGINTGSWYVPAVSPVPVLHMLLHLWDWLLGLPFLIVGWLVRGTNRALPVARYCARYQNWLLIRLYNTARGAFSDALSQFRATGDERGMLEAEHRLADIQQLFGYPTEALARLTALLERPPAQEPYRRAELLVSMAACQLDLNKPADAQKLLNEALPIFRALGDVRNESMALALQGRVLACMHQDDAALQSFQSSLKQFRTRRYAAARERVLHILRTWRRDAGEQSPIGQRIGAIVAAEPEKRYVGRFIRSYQWLLRAASVLTLPLALLVLAIVVPSYSPARILADGTILAATLSFDPLRVVGVLALLGMVYLACYAALGLVIIFALPLSRIEEREQPDIIETTPERIARYNSRGDLVEHMPWPSIRRWISLDRCIWSNPLPLYSRSFLEDLDNRDLRIDGITGWYRELQEDVGQRFAHLHLVVPQESLGYNLLRSKSGALAVLGLLLMLLFTLGANVIPLTTLLPPQLYAALALLALSGACILIPMAYWLATRPLQLQRTLELDERWPYLIGLLGLLPVAVYLVSGGALPTSIPILNVSLVVWGVYMLSEGLVALLPRVKQGWRTALLAVLLLATVALLAPRIRNIYNDTVSSAANDQAVLSNVQGAPDAAIDIFTQANQTATPDSAEAALALYNRSLVYRRQGDQAAFQRDWDEAKRICRDPIIASDPVCQRIINQRITDLR
ncbi:MAG: tetratricopeptide repeat protein [Chloroflexaceae bacterium]|nr:tetratricopeptide repeat protein [Chloroflexaceae bacterium]